MIHYGAVYVSVHGYSQVEGGQEGCASDPVTAVSWQSH